MLDHVTLAVSDLDRARRFYDAALAPLGIAARATDGAHFVGYGAGRAFFWIGLADAVRTGTHVAFVAARRADVTAFHQAALAAGGRDNGAPGLRPQYDRDYFAAFVLDPDGHNVEAVCRLAA